MHTTPPQRRRAALTLVLGLSLSCHLVTLPASARTAGAGNEAQPERTGDLAWEKRSPGPRQQACHRDFAEQSVDAYEKALSQQPDDFDLHVKTMQALYFLGHFCTEASKEQRQLFERQLALSVGALDWVAKQAGFDDYASLEKLSAKEQATALATIAEAKEAHFWAAISWGLWGTSHSALAAARRGVAKRIRNHAEVLIELDEAFADAGGLRLLGRLHTKAPKVPLVSGWIDRSLGIRLLRRANELSTADLRNPLFLAEALLDHVRGGKTEAQQLLADLIARKPRSDWLAEDGESLDEACRLLAESGGPSCERPQIVAGDTAGGTASGGTAP